MKTDNTGKTEKVRYVFIDALRGIAALAVVLHHLLHSSVLEPTLRKALWEPVLVVSHYGAHGVQTFFVLSGFVIAFSLRNTLPTGSNITNFMIRRQLRLDRPYWAILFVTLIAMAGERLIPSFNTPPLPSVLETAANLFYLQDITRAKSIVSVAWTLCIEIQFYLVFIMVLTLSRRISYRVSEEKQMLQPGSVIAVFAIGVLSLLVAEQHPYFVFKEKSPWFLYYWFYFAAGALCCWAVHRNIPQTVWFAFAGCFLTLAVCHPDPGIIVGLVTASMLYVVGRLGYLAKWGGNPVLQYFGRISYSLYLVHMLVAVSTLKLGYKLTGEDTQAAVWWFLLAGIVSIGAGHLLYRFVETPSMRLASALKNSPSKL